MPRMRTVAATTALVGLLAVPAAADAARTASETAERKMTAAINSVRAEHGLPAFKRSASLTGSAERYSRWLMENDVFGHQSSIQASSRFKLLGEALEMHTGHRFEVWTTVRRWLGSPSHSAILLSPVMRWVGTGVTRGRYGAVPTTMWVLQTGKLGPSGSPRVPGVSLP